MYNKVKALIAAGNKGDAADLLLANFEAVMERINAGTKGMDEASFISIIALGYKDLGHLKSLKLLLDTVSSFFPSTLNLMLVVQYSF